MDKSKKKIPEASVNFIFHEKTQGQRQKSSTMVKKNLKPSMVAMEISQWTISKIDELSDSLSGEGRCCCLAKWQISQWVCDETKIEG